MNYTAIWLLRLIVPEICAEFRDLRCMFVCKAWYTMIREYMITEGKKITINIFNKTKNKYINLFLLKFLDKEKLYLPNKIKHGEYVKVKYYDTCFEDYIKCKFNNITYNSFISDKNFDKIDYSAKYPYHTQNYNRYYDYKINTYAHYYLRLRDVSHDINIKYYVNNKLIKQVEFSVEKYYDCDYDDYDELYLDIDFTHDNYDDYEFAYCLSEL